MTAGRSAKRLKIAVLISGSGSNLQAFIDRANTPESGFDIVRVISNRADAFGLQRARDAEIASTCIEHQHFESRESFDRAVAAALDGDKPDLIILAGFMRILSPWFVSHYQGRILNIHPALLPKYPGLDTHARVIKAGDAQHGSTVHFVTEELDGGPRVLSGRIRVQEEDTADGLRGRVQAVEHRIYPDVVEWFAEGRLRYKDGAAWLDGRELTEPVGVDFD